MRHVTIADLRVILGGLLAGEPATLFILPMLYSLLVRDKPGAAAPTAAKPAEPAPDAGQA